jgi:hypothetical protein
MGMGMKHGGGWRGRSQPTDIRGEKEKPTGKQKQHKSGRGWRRRTPAWIKLWEGNGLTDGRRTDGGRIGCGVWTENKDENGLLNQPIHWLMR